MTIQNCLDFVVFVAAYDCQRRRRVNTTSYQIRQNRQKFNEMEDWVKSGHGRRESEVIGM